MGIFGKKKTEEKKSGKGAKSGDIAAGKKAKPEKADKATRSVSMKELYAGSGKAAAGKEKSEKKAITGKAAKILVKPLITEKAANLGAQNKYVFEVSQAANKIEIAKAVAEVYGVKPLEVNIIRTKGKKVRYGRTFGRRKDWKKAMVKLPAGQSINIYEGV